MRDGVTLKKNSIHWLRANLKSALLQLSTFSTLIDFPVGSWFHDTLRWMARKGTVPSRHTGLVLCANSPQNNSGMARVNKCRLKSSERNKVGNRRASSNRELWIRNIVYVGFNRSQRPCYAEQALGQRVLLLKRLVASSKFQNNTFCLSYHFIPQR